MRGLCLHVLWLGLLALLLSSCGGAPRPSAPTPSGWMGAALGARPDGVLVVRVDRALADPVYGPMLAPRHGGSVDRALASVKDIEAWMIADGFSAEDSSIVFVLHATPELEALRSTSRDFRETFRDGTTRLPSGIDEHLGLVKGRPLVAYRYPTGTWVAALGRVVPRVQGYVRATGAEPPRTDYEQGALLAMYAGPALMRLSNVREHPGSKGLEDVWAVVQASSRGDVKFAGTYDTEENAKRAFDLSSSLLAAYGPLKDILIRRCPPLAELELSYERDGRAIAGRVGNLPRVLGALKAGACRDDREAYPTTALR